MTGPGYHSQNTSIGFNGHQNKIKKSLPVVNEQASGERTAYNGQS